MPPSRRAAKRWPYVVVVIVSVLVILATIADRINLNEYALAPGVAQSVTSFISVPANDRHHVHGQILLTDVLLSQISLLDYLPDKWNHQIAIEPAADLLGPTTPPAQLVAQGYIEMSQSQDFAKTAALSHLGYHVSIGSAGALVISVDPKSPTGPFLQVGQTITGVNGHTVTDACDLIDDLYNYVPGQRVALHIERSTVTTRAHIDPGSSYTRSVTLAPIPKSLQGQLGSGCPGVGSQPKAYLGVGIEDLLTFKYPINVNINIQNIGGPSAGLAMTLGIMDELSNGKLTGGHIIAATGTIDPEGDVGDVGGVAQKTVAVERAGATVFFVPVQELAAARSEDIPSLHIYAVSKLSQVLTILHRLGGTVPTPAPG